jgi:hypothetical protein
VSLLIALSGSAIVNTGSGSGPDASTQPALPSASELTRADVEAMLSARHLSSLPAQDKLRSLSPRIDPILIEIAGDPTELDGLRGRALAAMGLLATPAIHQFFVTLFASIPPSYSPALQAIAVQAFSMGFPNDMLALAAAQNLLGNEDAIVRNAAVRAAARHGRAGRELLLTHRRVEKHAAVRKTLDTLLNKDTPPAKQ